MTLQVEALEAVVGAPGHAQGDQAREEGGQDVLAPLSSTRPWPP